MSRLTLTLISAVFLIAVAIRFDLYCVRDLAKAEVVFHFPREVWFYIIIFSTPLGGMTYLMIGKPR